MSELLVSVRSVAEAEKALAGGAGLIDVKEPHNGPMGRASSDVIRAVCDHVADRAPVSAALGELLGSSSSAADARLRFAKWGLAGCRHRRAWRGELVETAASWRHAIPSCQPVVVAYADWENASAPRPMDVCDFATEHRWGAYLLDTWSKNGKTLLDWLSEDEIARLCRKCRAARVGVALAGSLGAREIIRLKAIKPDWFAVRGSACAGQDRQGAIDENRVRSLVSLLQPNPREN